MRQPVVFVVLLALLVTAAHAEQTRSINTKIEAVTVFPQQAMVTRAGTVSLGTGEYEIVFSDLPGAINTESVRLSGEGTASVKLSGVEVRRNYVDTSKNPRVAAIEDSILALRDETSILEGRTQALEQKRKFLEAILPTTATDISKELPTTRPSVGDWRSVVKFVYEGLMEVVNEVQLIKVRGREISAEIARLEQELADIRGPGASVTYNATAGVSCSRAGSVELNLTYLIPGAGWEMRYRATQTDKGAVELEVLGRVHNSTGEDWEDIELTLSTAQPMRGVTVPGISPWVLYVYEPALGGIRRDVTASARMAREASGEYDMAMDAIVGAPPPEAVQMAVMVVEQQGAVVNFQVPGYADIPADGSIHTKTVTTKTFTHPEMEYRAVPRFAEAVFSVATMTNGSDYPLLAGTVEVFDRATFLGTTYLSNVAPGQEFSLPMGIDDRVKVTFGLVRKITDPDDKKTEVRYVYRSIFTSFVPEPIEVLVKDHIPISNTDEIKIKDVRLSPPAKKRQDNGICEWLLRLSPRQETEISVEFTVEYPTGRSIQGLF
jgi:uncharacterized protein (TIGR02231 family)